VQAAIPYPELTRRYVELAKATSSQRLECAAQATADEYAALVCASIAAFSEWEVPDTESFYPDDPARDLNKSSKQAQRTYGWAMALKRASDPLAVDGDPCMTLSYVAREVCPTRTPASQTGRSVSTDLILRDHVSGRPVVAELKIGRDKDPFTALVQVLAAAAQLAPPAQRARLRTLDAALPGWSEDPRLEVVVLLAEFPVRNRHRWEQLAYASRLSVALEQHPEVREHLSRIRFLQIFRDGTDRVTLSASLPVRAVVPQKPGR